MKTFIKYFLIVGGICSSLCLATGEAQQEKTEKTDFASLWAGLKQAAQGTAQNVLQVTKDVATSAVQGAHQGAQAAAEKIRPELLNKIDKIIDQSEGYLTKAKYVGACVLISQLMILGLCSVTAYNSFSFVK